MDSLRESLASEKGGPYVQVTDSVSGIKLIRNPPPPALSSQCLIIINPVGSFHGKFILFTLVEES